MYAIERVVFDCNVYFQALISQVGPAAQCFRAVREGQLLLHVSQRVIEEFRGVCLRPNLAARFALTDDRVSAFIADVEAFAVFIGDVPHVFDYPRDPDDAHYVDLAIASNAKLIVSRDRDLLALCDLSRPVAIDFHNRFPDISILTPVELLNHLSQQVADE